jgi:stearoyl-CoA desaturase (delta-9 desaturase)
MISLSWVGFILVIVGYVHLASVTISLYLHRSLEHKAVTFHPILNFIFQGILWMMFRLPDTYGLAFHLVHHEYSDTIHDPANVPTRSSKFFTFVKKPLEVFFTVTLFSKVIPLTTKKITQPQLSNEKKKFLIDACEKYTPHLSDNYKWAMDHALLGSWIFIAVNVILFGWSGWVIVAVLMFILTYLGITYIDGLIHLYGYQNYDLNDHSKNLMPWSIFTGEELHNNHHKTPQCANFAHRWFEFDIVYFYIKVFKWLRLAEVK